ncbi:MAG: hypothetical protein L0H83_04220 [Salinisphaera sp.]|nr:hypothetical protein [Salinisphaera sp.]
MLAGADAMAHFGIHYRMQTTGEPIDMQAHPCLTSNAQAWAPFSSRSPQPDYSNEPQFAVVPRTIGN